MRAADEMLARALAARGACRIVAAEQRRWASVTFTGARHRLRLELDGAGAEAFLDGIGEAEFDLGDHLLADLVVTGREAEAEGVAVAIEALTIEAN